MPFFDEWISRRNNKSQDIADDLGLMGLLDKARLEGRGPTGHLLQLGKLWKELIFWKTRATFRFSQDFKQLGEKVTKCIKFIQGAWV